MLFLHLRFPELKKSDGNGISYIIAQRNMFFMKFQSIILKNIAS